MCVMRFPAAVALIRVIDTTPAVRIINLEIAASGDAEAAGARRQNDRPPVPWNTVPSSSTSR